MQAGPLSSRIAIQRKTAAADAWGTPEPQGWEDVAKVWSNVRHQSGSESIRAGADVSIVRASIRIRWRTGIDAGMRVRYGGQVGDIEAGRPGADRTYVDLVCKLLPVTDAPTPEPEPEPDLGGGGWG